MIVHHAAGLSPIGDGLGMHIPTGLHLLDVESFLRSYNTETVRPEDRRTPFS